MKIIKTIVYTILFISIFFIGCNRDDTSVNSSNTKSKICPQCNMPLPSSNINTSHIKEDGVVVYFDDIGCMVLYAKKRDIDLKNSKTVVFSSDTKKFIDPYKAYFRIDEITPMKYGFAAYEKPCERCIRFDEVITRMLRGEHMANPKIRKHILEGYKIGKKSINISKQ